jgi:enoyl-CoA hydratase/carnithine racemase
MVESQERDLGYEERRDLVERSVSRAVEAVYDCRLPVVAKLDGAAYGAGAGLLLACDVQLASPDARIGFGFRRVGLAVDSGVSHLLARYVGLNTAKELVFTGELLDADRARELGLVTRLFERDSFEEGVESVVETIAAGPTAALATSKELLNRPSASLARATDEEERAQAALLGSRDHAEGARAFIERREPSFEGR